MKDKDLIKGLKNKKRSALEKVIETYSAYVNVVVYNTIGNAMSKEDMEEVIAGIMEDYRALPSDTGVLCLGHGTDHYSNFTYPAFEYTARRMGYSRLFIGTVEGYPDIETVISHVLQSGCKKMILLPLLFVAGDHARNDMAGEEPDSWKSRLNASGIQTTCVLKGLGEYPAIQHLFLKHMERA